MTIQLLTDKRGFKNIYDEIYIISPTFDQQQAWKKLKPDGIKVIVEMNDNTLKYLADQTADPSKKQLILTDDIGEELRHVNPKLLNMLVSNSRHTNTSFIFLHQKLTQCPPICRAQADVIIAFAACSYLERDCLWKEVSVVDKQRFLKIFNHCTEAPHSFMVASNIDGRMTIFESDFCTVVPVG